MAYRKQITIVFLAILLLGAGVISVTKLGLSPLQTVQPTSTAAPLAPGLGGLRGQVSNVSELWGKKEVYAYAAPFFGDASKGEGIFALQPALHPSTRLGKDGLFLLINVQPGFYVVVIGPTPQEALAVRGEGNVRIFQVFADQIADLGSIELSR